MRQAQTPNPHVAFDVFLSHNSQDKPAVWELAQALESRGLRVWLDEEQLVPGRPWQEALEKTIQTAGAAAVLIGKSGLGSWETPEMRACLAEFVSRKLPVIPVLLPDAPKEPELPLLLRGFTWVDMRAGLNSGGLEKLVWSITGLKPEPAPGRPEGGPQPSAARILVATRPYALPTGAGLPRFKTLDLAPLNGEQIDRFAGRWYRELQRANDWSDGETAAKIASLRSAVGPQSDLRELAAQPLLLTLVASLHSRLSPLPGSRAELYETAVALLLSSRWHDASEDGQFHFLRACAEPLRQGKGPIRDGLQAVAFHLHQQRSRQAADADVPMDMPYREVCGWFAEILPKDCSAASVVEFLEQRVGILIRNSEGSYGFPHRSFQEYLAACHLNDHAIPDTATALLDLLRQAPGWWREVFLLALGKAQNGGVVQPLAILTTLVPKPPENQPADSDWRIAIPAGLGLRQLRVAESTAKHPLAQGLFERIDDAGVPHRPLSGDGSPVPSFHRRRRLW